MKNFLNKPVSMAVMAALVPMSVIALTACDDDPSEIVSIPDPSYVKNQAVDKAISDWNSKEKPELDKLLAEMRQKDPSLQSIYYSDGENGDKQLHMVFTADGSPAVEDTQDTVDKKDLETAYDSTWKTEDEDDLDKDDSSSNVSMPYIHTTPSYNNDTAVASNAAGGYSNASSTPNHSLFNEVVVPMAAGATGAVIANTFMNGGLNGVRNAYPTTSYNNLNNADRKSRYSSALNSHLRSSLTSNRAYIRSGIRSGNISRPTINTTRGSLASRPSLSTSSKFFSRSSNGFSSGARSGGYSSGG